jgi:hypothetical protein
VSSRRRERLLGEAEMGRELRRGERSGKGVLTSTLSGDDPDEV